MYVYTQLSTVPGDNYHAHITPLKSQTILGAYLSPLSLPVVPGTDGTLILKLVIETALMEGMLTEEVDSWERETSLAQSTLHHLEDLGTAGEHH